MKILAIDDSSTVRKIIKKAALVLKVDMVEAEDGIQGLEILENLDGEINLILLDWNMPRMNGLEFLKNIKANEKYKNIPVMMVTSESEKNNIVQAVKAGLDDYMAKPFTIEELTTKILEWLERGETNE